MKIATATLRSVSPYSQNKIVQETKKDKELPDAYEKRTWRGRMHHNGDGLVFIPLMQFSNSIKEAAKYLSIQIPGKGKATYTKHFESGIMVMNHLPLGVKVDDVPFEWISVPSDGIRGGGKRVAKCFPLIHSWAGDVKYMIMDEIITRDVFAEVLEASGILIGIGRFRPRNLGYYGRFEVEALTWEDYVYEPKA